MTSIEEFDIALASIINNPELELQYQMINQVDNQVDKTEELQYQMINQVDKSEDLQYQTINQVDKSEDNSILIQNKSNIRGGRNNTSVLLNQENIEINKNRRGGRNNTNVLLNQENIDLNKNRRGGRNNTNVLLLNQENTNIVLNKRRGGRNNITTNVLLTQENLELNQEILIQENQDEKKNDTETKLLNFNFVSNFIKFIMHIFKNIIGKLNL
jgi:hypothetical protein